MDIFESFFGNGPEKKIETHEWYTNGEKTYCRRCGLMVVFYSDYETPCGAPVLD